ncbi:hypothetical protein [Nocardioides sp. B-3]|uniref:hypothetical protein n=1 Tax=Nocardioides sp. B-3 TaxID=2895565 RepID=UPI0021523829|nr:hypothetical protein [Nocardioides sp. B-3]UUZ60415.1 hypothetical protein LP418_05825 [Nocardioides sp. B-3]
MFDNQYLLTLVDSGVIGLLAFLSIFAAACYAAVRVMWLCRRSPARLKMVANDRDLALSLTASMVVLLPTYATFDLGSFATVTSTFFVLAGVCGALLRAVHADVESEAIDEHAIY